MGFKEMLIRTGSTDSSFLDVTRMPMSTVSFLALLDPGFLCQQNAFL